MEDEGVGTGSGEGERGREGEVQPDAASIMALDLKPSCLSVALGKLH